MEKKKPGVLSELWRKFLVALKRRPQNIALVSLVITFLFYALLRLRSREPEWDCADSA